MRRGLSSFVGKRINIYNSFGELLITGVVNDAKYGFIVANPHPDFITRYAYVCKRKLVLKKFKGVQKEKQNNFCVKIGHAIFTQPASKGFKY